MDLYHIWCDLKTGVGDMDFTDKLNAYLGGLANAGKIESYRITRRKLGLGREGLGEFHIMIDTRDLAQLDQAFRVVASRAGPVHIIGFRRQKHPVATAQPYGCPAGMIGVAGHAV